MAKKTKRVRLNALEDHPVTILARMENLNGDLITQSNVVAIEYSVFDIDSKTPDTRIASGNVSVVRSVFNSLQLDDRWDIDRQGFNFAHTQAATVFSTGSRQYDLEYEFTGTAGVQSTFGLGVTLHIMNWRTR